MSSSAYRSTRRVLANGSKSFSAASYLLPSSLREDATAIYAFCRLADDAVDDDAALAPERLAKLREQVEAIYSGCGLQDEVLGAFQVAVQARGIPHAAVDGLLEGFEWDLEGRTYFNLSDLYAYCVRVGSTVGVMMALLVGCREKKLLARACDLGVAMQLTNIARDVGEDAARRRIYLPLTWLEQEHVDLEGWMRRPVASAPLRRAVSRLLQVADQFYRRADSGLAGVPLVARPALYAARLIYSDIGRVIRQNAFNSVDQRAVVSPLRKAALLGESLLSSSAGVLRDQCEEPPLKEATFLVDAALAR